MRVCLYEPGARKNWGVRTLTRCYPPLHHGQFVMEFEIGKLRVIGIDFTVTCTGEKAVSVETVFLVLDSGDLGDARQRLPIIR